MTQKVLTKEAYERFVTFAEKHDWFHLESLKLPNNKDFETWVSPSGESYKIGIGG